MDLREKSSRCNLQIKNCELLMGMARNELEAARSESVALQRYLKETHDLKDGDEINPDTGEIIRKE